MAEADRASAFSGRLELILKALSLTRGRLAAELAVDKSLVGRWASGAVRPSAHNLQRLTQLIATRQPGFNLLDWDRDIDALAEKFGVAPPGAPAAATLPIDGLLPDVMVRESAITT
ncbi:MAG: helix-turn-helix domain-containing protein, partial [Polymorphobacter sp.]